MIKIIAVPVDTEKETLHFTDGVSCMNFFHINRVQLMAMLEDFQNDEINGYFLDKEIKGGKLRTNEERKVWEHNYNNLMNEGGEGYVPHYPSVEEYESAKARLNK